MSREILSQDEIDALLKEQGDGEENNSSTNLDEILSPFDQDALGEIGNISFGTASTALSTLLGQKVEITTPKVSAVKKENLNKEFPSPHVAIHVEYTEGFKGISLFVINSRDAKVIANLMMGGNGEAVDDEELSDMDISAVQEAMNQMMGSAATSMSTVFNMMVNISPPGVDVLDLQEETGSENLPNEDIIVMVSFRLRIGNLIDSSIMQLTTVEFAKEMINKLLGSSDEVEEDIEDTPSEAQDPAPAPKNNHQPSGIAAEQPRPSEQAAAYSRPAENPTLGNSHPANSNINVQSAQFSDLNNSHQVKNNDPNLNLLMDIPLQITVELGRTKKIIKDILELSHGSVIELDKLAGEPVDILANNKLIAKGEVVVIDENFGVRVTDIISEYERVRKLQ